MVRNSQCCTRNDLKGQPDTEMEDTVQFVSEVKDSTVRLVNRTDSASGDLGTVRSLALPNSSLLRHDGPTGEIESVEIALRTFSDDGIGNRHGFLQKLNNKVWMG